MLPGEIVRHRHDVEHADADGLLLLGGHQRFAEVHHPLQRAAEPARHRHVAARQGRRAFRRVHLQEVDLARVHAQMLQRAQHLVMRHVAHGARHLPALQVLRVGLGDARVLVDDAVVVLRVGHRRADQLQRGALGHPHHEGRQPLGVGDLHVARHHRGGHLVAVAERTPVDLGAHLLVEGAVGLERQVRRRPLQEVRHRDLVAMPGRCSGGGCHHAQGRQGACHARKPAGCLCCFHRRSPVVGVDGFPPCAPDGARFACVPASRTRCMGEDRPVRTRNPGNHPLPRRGSPRTGCGRIGAIRCIDSFRGCEAV